MRLSASLHEQREFPDITGSHQSSLVGWLVGPATELLGLTLQTFAARSLGEMEPAFEAMARAGMQAVVAVQGGTAFQGRALIPKLALSRGIAMCAYSRETFEHGALVS